MVIRLAVIFGGAHFRLIGLTNSDGLFLAGVAALVRQQGTVCALKIKVHKPSFSSLSISNHSFYFFVFSGTKI